MKAIFFILAIFLMLTTQASAEVKHFCDDPKAKAEWEALIEMYPDGLNVYVLNVTRSARE